MTYGGSRVFIGGISSDVSKDDIGNEFSKYGKLKNVWVAQNPPGFAFVEFDNDRDAEEAVKSLNGATLFNDNKIRVEHSKTRSGSGGGGFSGGFRRGRGRGGMGSFNRESRQGSFRKNMNSSNFRNRSFGENRRNDGNSRFNKGMSRYNSNTSRERPYGNRGAQSKFIRNNKDGPPKFDNLRHRGGGHHGDDGNHSGGSGMGRKNSGRNNNKNFSSGNNQNSFRKTSPMDL